VEFAGSNAACIGTFAHKEFDAGHAGVLARPRFGLAAPTLPCSGHMS